MKVIIIDFEDSFTYNIANFYHSKGKIVEVISYESFFSDSYFSSVVDIHSNVVLVLGPGPGHPEKYRCFHGHLLFLLSKKNFFILGICLGHQIIGELLGYEVKKLKNPVHGSLRKVLIKNKYYQVQHYNSLGVFEGKNQIHYFDDDNFESYQFHPESVATFEKIVFFNKSLNFI